MALQDAGASRRDTRETPQEASQPLGQEAQQERMFSAACCVLTPPASAARSTSFSVMFAEFPWSSLG